MSVQILYACNVQVKARRHEGGDAGTRGHRDTGTQGSGDAGMQGRRTRGCGDVGMRECDKQTTPEFCVEFVIYNFRWSRGRYYMLESLPADQ